MAAGGERLRAGDLLARRYLLVEPIGSGGMSVIWQGFDQTLRREVAIKVRDAPLSSARSERELIRHEAQATAHIDHPDAIEVYDYGEAVTSRGRLAAYVVMQLVDGPSLTERIEEGPLPWREAVAIAARVAGVLSVAHQRGIVHRDITPDNVLLTTTGVKLLDFGIAARVGERSDQSPGTTFGTPPYVAPERLYDGPVVAATDVYSLGVLLFEMLTGHTPYPETTWEEVERARRTGPPPLPSGVEVPDRLARLCQRCLATDPSLRPTIDAVVSELRAIVRADRLVAKTRGRAVRAGGILIAAAAVSAATVVIADRLTGDEPAPRLPPLAGPTSPRALSESVEAVPTTAPPTLAPSPSATPSVTPSATPSPSATAAPLATPILSVNDAVANIDQILNAGVAAGEVRDDVARDLKQMVRNVVANPTGNQLSQIDGLRQKAQERAREGALSAAVASRLGGAFDALGNALDRASRTP